MPYANNAGTRIHYQTDGTGPDLVLQHGFTQCLEDWSECGYVAALRSKYRLILVDARGHGGSDKPHDEVAYALPHRVADVTTVLDALGIEKAHFWGYSMGGYIGFGMAKYAPERVDYLVIGGQHPYMRDQSALRQWLRDGITMGRDTLVAAFEKMVGPISSTYAERLRAADLQAYLAAAHDRVGMQGMLGAMTMPCCLYAGEADPIFAKGEDGGRAYPECTFLFPTGALAYASVRRE